MLHTPSASAAAPPSSLRHLARRLLAVGALAAAAVAATAVTAGPAAADPIASVTADGAPIIASSHLVPSDVSLSGGQLSVINPPGDGYDTLTEVDGTVAGGTVNSIQAPFFPITCQISGASFKCPTGIGIGPGSNINFPISYTGDHGLSNVDLIFNLGQPVPCLNGGGDVLADPLLAVAAAPDCNVPGNAKITGAHIDSHAGKATFRFKAHGAHSFSCELVRNGTIAFQNSCSSPKIYHGPLGAGKYVFVVWGADAGGLSHKSATKKFTLS
jgi:hypothetical protein